MNNYSYIILYACISYFTTQKRLLRIGASKDLLSLKKKYKKSAKPFITAQLGVYDLKKAFELEWEEYKQFVSGLFEIEIINLLLLSILDSNLVEFSLL